MHHTNIENIQKEIIIKLLNKNNIINNLQKERKPVVILDNYSVHKANLVIQACEILNIKLIHLPPHSPPLKSNRTSLKINKKVYNILFI